MDGTRLQKGYAPFYMRYMMFIISLWCFGSEDGWSGEQRFFWVPLPYICGAVGAYLGVARSFPQTFSRIQFALMELNDTGWDRLSRENWKGIGLTDPIKNVEVGNDTRFISQVKVFI